MDGFNDTKTRQRATPLGEMGVNKMTILEGLQAFNMRMRLQTLVTNI